MLVCIESSCADILDQYHCCGQHLPYQSDAVFHRKVEKFSIQLFRSLIVIVDLLFYVHGKHLRSCRDGQLA